MKKEIITSLGAMAAALLAATCCIGSLAFVLFGTSLAFLEKLSFMEVFRPCFLGLAGLMAGYSNRFGFIRIYPIHLWFNCRFQGYLFTLP